MRARRNLARHRKPLAINLALQGGGAHGAYTWGVLDRLLEEPDLELHWVSGTSAGAVNAAALASGIASGGYASARTILRYVWEKVMAAAPPDISRSNPLLATFFHMAQMSNMAAMMSPYDFNPLGFDPLRRILEDAIDFTSIRRHPGADILIAATDVETGRARLFRRKHLKVEHVLASACLPSLHHAVEIDGRFYWDGGFSANPDLITLALESPCRDTLLIELNPRIDTSRPRSAAEISARVANITFSQPLVRDLQMIAAAKSHETGFFAGMDRSWRSGVYPNAQRSHVAKLRRHHFHIIEAGRHTSRLGQSTKMQADRAMVTALFEAGRADAKTWFETHRGDIGQRSTLDFASFHNTPSTVPPSPPADARVKGLDSAPAVTAPGSVSPFRRPRADRNPR